MSSWVKSQRGWDMECAHLAAVITRPDRKGVRDYQITTVPKRKLKSPSHRTKK